MSIQKAGHSHPWDSTPHLPAAGIGGIKWVQPKEGTATCAAIEWAMSTGFSAERGERPGAKNVMIVMTDGKPTDNKNHKLAQLSAAARASGIHIMSIGIGGTYDMKSLQVMATQPYADNVFGIKTYNPSTVASQVINSACEKA